MVNETVIKGEGVAVVIVAAGRGERMGGKDSLPKQFLPLAGVPVLVRTLRRFRKMLPGASFIVVLPEEYIQLWDALCTEWELEGTHEVCTGGKTRFESVRNALEYTGKCRLVAVHDGVRPLFCESMVREAVAMASEMGSAVPAVEPVDSFRIITPEGSAPVEREKLRAVQTPQVFEAELLRRAYGVPYDPAFTDDASVVEHLGVRIHLCPGERRNIKLTTPEDMALAEAWIAAGE